jgi:hypothetical protein
MSSEICIQNLIKILSKFTLNLNILALSFVVLLPKLEFVKLNLIAVLLVLQNRYSQSCIAIEFRRCKAVQCRKRSNSLNL